MKLKFSQVSWRFASDPSWNFQMGGGSPPPVYQPPPPTPPDPFAVANAQQGYNINAAVAQNQLNNVNQVTPYGNINYQQNGGNIIGASPAIAATPATGGYWNGSSWVPTGGTAGTPAFAGTFVPKYTATTTLNPQLQGIVNTTMQNAQGNANLESGLLQNVQNTASKPLDLSWGNIANNIYGLEKNTLDPQWAQASQVNAQSLADQGLTPGSQGAAYQNTQFGLDKSNAYNQAMLQAQGQAVSDITTQYNSPINTLSALRSNSQIQQPGVGQTASSAQGNVGAAPYANVAQSNYAIGSQNFNAAQQAVQSQYQAQQQQQNQLMGGLFGLGGQLLGGLGGLASDRRMKTDVQKFGTDPESKLPIYAYRYKGDPKTYPKVVGPMAQDVKKVAPEAVHSEEGGHLAISADSYFGLGGRV
jgi:Chaperone of endosialidase